MLEEKVSSKREKSSRVAALEESGVATRNYGASNRGQKTLGDAWEKSQVVAGQDTFLKKKKIISGSCPGGVWSCYPGHSVSKRGGKILQEIPGRSIGWIADSEVSFEREKSSQVSFFVESGAATWVCGA